MGCAFKKDDCRTRFVFKKRAAISFYARFENAQSALIQSQLFLSFFFFFLSFLS